MCACCLFYRFLARKTSLSASSGLRHRDLLWLRNTNLGSNIFCMWMNLQLFHCIYEQHVFSDMQRDCINRDPFFSYRTQWLNDSPNAGCFLAGICGLPRSSRSETSVPSRRQFEMLKKKVKSAAFSYNSLWTNFAADGGLFKVRRHKTQLLKRQCLFRNKLFARCLLCLFLCGESMRGEGGTHYELQEPMRSDGTES